MTTVAVRLPEDSVVWQAVCDRCDARYAVLHADVDDAPHPRFCVFCAARASFRLVRGDLIPA